MLSGIVEVEDFTATVPVGPLESDTLTRGQEGNGAKASPVGLNGKGIEVSQQAPFGSELLQSNVNALPSGIGLAAVGQEGTGRHTGSTLASLLDAEGSLLVFAYAIEVVGDTSLGSCPQGRIRSQVVLVFVQNRIEHAALQPFAAGIRVLVTGNGSEDTVKELTRGLLHSRGHRTVEAVTVNVAPHPAAAKISAGDQAWHHAGRKALRIKVVPNNLVNRWTARLGPAIRRHGSERTGGAIKMSVDAFLVATHLVDLAQNEQLVAERLQGFHHPGKTILLDWFGNAQAEEDVKGTGRDRLARGRRRSGRKHFLQKRQPDADGSDAP